MMTLQRNVGMLFLSVYLILMGLISIIDGIPISHPLLDVMGILVGCLLIIGR